MAIIDKLVEVNKLKTELNELLPMSIENDKKFWKKIRLDWNFNSNHIEGNTLTYGETQLLLIFDKTTGDHDLREYQEMKAHDVAIHMIKEWAEDRTRDLSEKDIRELNKVILVQPYWKEAVTSDRQPTKRQIKVGEYKEYPNSVRLKNGEVFEYTPPLETPQKMEELMSWYKNNDIQHPLILASQLHYDFIRIHPFDDGNGRVARLLVNYVLMKNDYPPIIVKSLEKEKYLTALNKADVGDINAFHEYMAEQLIWSLELAIKAAKGKNIEDVDDLDKELSLLRMELKGDVLTSVANSDNICDAMEVNIIPIFTMIEEKCENLKEFFFETNRKFYFETDGGNNRTGTNLEGGNLEQLKQNWLAMEIREKGEKLKHIRYAYELNGLKKTVAGNSFGINLEIYFNQYNYIIQTYSNRNNPLVIPYGKELSVTDLQYFVNPLMKIIIEDIRRLS
jgi:Fic family protein